jgi:hypothetical protein
VETQILRHRSTFNPHATVIGRLLEKGDKISSTDMYASTCGKWEEFPCSGQVHQGNPDVQIVRPYTLEVHFHPKDNLKRIWAVRLQVGDIVQEGDYFAATDGTWRKFTSLGHVILGGDKTYWVRMF